MRFLNNATKRAISAKRRRVKGTGARRAQWAEKAGGASEIARSAQRRDYASFPD